MHERSTSLLLSALLAGFALLILSTFGGTHAFGQAALAPTAADLGSPDFEKVKAAVTALGFSKEPAAFAILVALDEDKLKLDKAGTPFIEQADGSLKNPLSGAVATSKQGLASPSLNNTLRRALRMSLANLRLRSKDTAARLLAAQTLAEAPGAESAALLHDALEHETDGEAREALQLAIAQIDLAGDDHAKKLAAIATIDDAGELSLKSSLEQIVSRATSGSAEDKALKSAAAEALTSLETKELFIRIVRDLFYGLSLGSVLLLAALGLAITFGLMGVINMAHGEMIMLGAYTTFVVQNFFARNAPGALDWYLPCAVPAAFVVCMAIGVGLERLVIRHLYGRPLETLLATWGISLGLIQLVRLVFGAANVTVANPSYLAGGFDLASGVTLPYARLVTVAFTVVVVGFVYYLLNKTGLGLQLRATTQNRAMARCMGIKAPRIDMLTFGLGSGVAGLGGVALSQLGNVGPELGQGYIVDSFMVVVLGGVGKLAGTVVAAVGLGTVNKLLEPLSGAVLGKIIVLVFIVLFIQRRPQGLFAPKGRAAEA
jgi:urea transport system permease protein